MGKGSSTTTTTQSLSPEQQKLLDLVIPVATDFATNTPQLYQGSTIAPLTQLEQQGRQGAINALSGIQSNIDQNVANSQAVTQAGLAGGLGGLGQLLGGLQSSAGARDFILSGDVLKPSSNPALQANADAVTGTIERGLTQKVLPSIRGAAAGAGQVGSSRQGIAEGLAIQGGQQAAGDATSKLFNNAYGQGLNAIVNTLRTTQGLGANAASQLFSAGNSGIANTGNLAKLQLLPSQILSAIGGQDRAFTQAQLTEQANQQNTNTFLPFIIAQDIAKLATGIPGGTTTSTGRTGGSNGLGSILGGIGSILSIL